MNIVELGGGNNPKTIKGATPPNLIMKPFKPRKTWKNQAALRYYIKHRDEILERERGNPQKKARLKAYREKNLDRLRAYDRERNKLPHRKLKDKKRHQELQFLWNNGLNAREQDRWKQAEAIAPKILKKERFTEVERTNFYFPFDCWGKLDGRFTAIEVTCSYKRQKKDIVKRFLKFSRWRYYVLFITSDLRKYILKECPNNQSVVRAISSKKDAENLKEVNV